MYAEVHMRRILRGRPGALTSCRVHGGLEMGQSVRRPVSLCWWANLLAGKKRWERHWRWTLAGDEGWRSSVPNQVPRRPENRV